MHPMQFVFVKMLDSKIASFEGFGKRRGASLCELACLF